MAPPSNIKPHNFSLSGFIQVTRFWNLLIIILAQYFTAVFLVNDDTYLLYYLKDVRLFLLSLSSVIIAAAGYIINDYYDVKIDLINKPERVVVGRILKRRVAMVAHTVLNFTGISLGFLLSWKIGVVNFTCALLLWLYSNQLKRMPLVGNLSVALLTGVAIYVVDMLYRSGNLMIIAYALFAFSFTLIREIIKDMEDLRGDATFGCKTLPVVYGIRKTKNIIYFLSAIFLAGLCFLAYIFVGIAMTLFCLGLIIPLGVLAYKLAGADTVKDFNYLSNYCKVVMLLGILSMIIFK
ncbi:(S)-2,3-di-O-geranylgeranylglyceryl phosphate synthase [Fulvivirga imtechensis AK7]|uniref:(S)-2,3-di-O-geranylgeranylglyceryl phosphate synthase n=1 Tax=Fulvivirga imtechensis AK7 TaxID=1237149 RepID=L8JYB8_9BACT|nr:geranylgeranylglycerol-phosphate geranylgeranyltransferase [Fulvivirga imtechensis]ELR72644.1 (S)-2,3-di-O-geranylgeranylglyceryl phosphate synthase [Fulvivirga imtechensis AK7]